MQQLDDMPPEFFEGNDILDDMNKELQRRLEEVYPEAVSVRREFYETQEEFLAAKNKFSTKIK
jgi:hypothetical protein